MTARGLAERFGLSGLLPAQWYLFGAGWFMLVHAVVDLVFYRQSTAVGPQAVAESHLFLGVFQLNLWHSLAGLVSALTFLAFGFSRTWSAPAALVNGVG